MPTDSRPIGIFDSGYGGLTILHGIRQLLPQYDYVYLGDNARAPYGPRSFEVVYEFTREAVEKLFAMGCQLIILGCNTASAKALRSLQQNDLPQWAETVVPASYFAIGIVSILTIFMTLSDKVSQRAMFGISAVMHVAGMALLGLSQGSLKFLQRAAVLTTNVTQFALRLNQFLITFCQKRILLIVEFL